MVLFVRTGNRLTIRFATGNLQVILHGADEFGIRFRAHWRCPAPIASFSACGAVAYATLLSSGSTVLRVCSPSRFGNAQHHDPCCSLTRCYGLPAIGAFDCRLTVPAAMQKHR